MDFKSIIKTVAPFIGTLIGGPMGGIATKILGDVFCSDENATEREIEKAVANASPEDFIKLKQINAETEKKYIDAGVDLEKIAAGDRDSARNRQVETNDRVPDILALFLTVGFFLTLYMVANYPIQKSAAATVDIMIGSISTVWLLAMGYYFGSSAGSKLKTLIGNK